MAAAEEITDEQWLTVEALLPEYDGTSTRPDNTHAPAETAEK